MCDTCVYAMSTLELPRLVARWSGVLYVDNKGMELRKF